MKTNEMEGFVNRYILVIVDSLVHLWSIFTHEDKTET
jgi:hypothetical protein